MAVQSLATHNANASSALPTPYGLLVDPGYQSIRTVAPPPSGVTTGVTANRFFGGLPDSCDGRSLLRELMYQATPVNATATPSAAPDTYVVADSASPCLQANRESMSLPPGSVAVFGVTLHSSPPVTVCKRTALPISASADTVEIPMLAYSIFFQPLPFLPGFSGGVTIVVVVLLLLFAVRVPVSLSTSLA